MKLALRLAGGLVIAAVALAALALASVGAYNAGEMSRDEARLREVSPVVGRTFDRFVHDLRGDPGRAFHEVVSAARAEADAGRFSLIWATRHNAIGGNIQRPGAECLRSGWGIGSQPRSVEILLVSLESKISLSFLEAWNRGGVTHPAFPRYALCGPLTPVRIDDDRNWVGPEIAWVRPDAGDEGAAAEITAHFDELRFANDWGARELQEIASSGALQPVIGDRLWFAGPAADLRLRTVQRLLEAGAEPNETWNGAPLLLWALDTRSLPLVRLLLQHGADPNAPCYCRTAHAPQRHRRTSSEPDFSVTDAMYALTRGAHLWVYDQRFPFPGQVSRMQMLDALIEAGGRPSLTQRTMDEAYRYAARAWNVEWLARLRELGANPSAVDEEGRGALDYALDELDLTPDWELWGFPRASNVRRDARRALVIEATVQPKLESAPSHVDRLGLCDVIAELQAQRAAMRDSHLPKLLSARSWCASRVRILRNLQQRRATAIQAAFSHPAVLDLQQVRAESLALPPGAIRLDLGPPRTETESLSR